MYRPPQAGRIAHDTIVKHLDPYGQNYSSKNPRLWKQNSQPIKFTLVVHDFGVKISRKEHALHLKKEIKTKYKVTTDWEGKFYIGIALKWEYKNERSNFKYQDMYAHHYIISNTINQKDRRTHHTPGHKLYTKKKSDAIRKSTN